MNNNYGINLNDMLEFDRITGNFDGPTPGLLLRPVYYEGKNDTYAFNTFVYKQNKDTFKELPFAPLEECGQLLFSRDFNGYGIDAAGLLTDTPNLMISTDLSTVDPQIKGPSSNDPERFSKNFYDLLQNTPKDNDDPNQFQAKVNDTNKFRLILGGHIFSTVLSEPPNVSKLSPEQITRYGLYLIFKWKLLNLWPKDSMTPIETQANGLLKTLIEDYAKQQGLSFDEAVSTLTNLLDIDTSKIASNIGFNYVIDNEAFREGGAFGKKFKDTLHQNMIATGLFPRLAISYFFVELNYNYISDDNQIVPSIVLGYSLLPKTEIYFEETRQILSKDDCFGNIAFSFYNINKPHNDVKDQVITIKKPDQSISYISADKIKEYPVDFQNITIDTNTNTIPFKFELAYRLITQNNKIYSSSIKFKAHYPAKRQFKDKLYNITFTPETSIGSFGIMYRNLPKFGIGNLKVAQRTEDDPFEPCQQSKKICKIYALVPDNDGDKDWFKNLLKTKIDETNNIFKRLNVEFIEKIVKVAALDDVFIADGNPWKQLAAFVPPNAFDYTKINLPQLSGDFIVLGMLPNFGEEMPWGGYLNLDNVNDNVNAMMSKDSFVLGGTIARGYGFMELAGVTMAHEIAHIFNAQHVRVRIDGLFKPVDKTKYLMLPLSDDINNKYIDNVNYQLINDNMNNKWNFVVEAIKPAYKSP